MPDEPEELKKLKGDFTIVLEVLRCVLRKSQGIQTTSEELKPANQVLGALLAEYEVPHCIENQPRRAVRIASDRQGTSGGSQHAIMAPFHRAAMSSSRLEL